MYRRNAHQILLPFTLALSLCVSGCLSSSYAIPAEELERLAELPPEQRSKVRVVQRLGWAEEPPEAFEEDMDAEATWYPEDHSYGTGYCHSIGPHRHVHGRILVHVSGGHHVGPGPAPRARAGGGGGKARLTGSHGGSFNVSGQKSLAFVVVAAAGVATVGLVATEGARFDGYAHLAPDHPLHLRRSDGSYQVVRLENLEPHHLSYVQSGIVTERDADVELGRRAPLDRQGFAWKFELGGLQLRAPNGDLPSKPAALMELGYFPAQELGLLAFASVGGGTHLGGDVLATRYGLSAEIMPLRFGRVHLGGYGWGGLGYDVSEGGALEDRAAQYYTVGAGALVEYDVTTRLAVTLRAGADWQRVHGEWTEPAFLSTLGVAVY